MAAQQPSSPLNHDSNNSGCRNGGYSSNASLLLRGKQQRQWQQQQCLHESGSRTDFTANINSSSSSAGKAPRCRPFGSWVPLLLLLLLRVMLLLLATLKQLLLSVCALLLLPVVGLALVAKHHPGPWKVLLLHSLYAGFGPWFASQLSSFTPGLGFWFPYGLLIPLPGNTLKIWQTGTIGTAATGAGVGGDGLQGLEGEQGLGEGGVWWGFVRNADSRFICGLSMMGILAPVTLWVGMLVQTWYLRIQYSNAETFEGASRGSLAVDDGTKGGQVLDDDWAREDQGVVTAQGFVITAARSSSSRSNRTSPGPSGCGGSKTAAAVAVAGDEEWQVVPLAEDDEGESLLDSCSNMSQAQQDLACEMVPPKQQQQQQGAPARLARSSPPRRRKETIGSAADGVAVADDSSSSSNGSNAVYSRQQQQQLSMSPSSAAAAAAAVLLRGASQVLLLPVVTSLLPVSTPAASAAQQQQHQQPPPPPAATAGSDSIGNSRPSCLLNRLGHRSLLWRVPVISRVVHWIQCGVLWVRATAVLLQMAAAALALPSLPLLLLLAGPAMVWCKANWRLAAAYGPTGILLSPVLGWLPALLALWLHTVKKQMGVGMGGRACGGCCTKGAWRIRTE
jgi:hypothetical protein